MHFFGAAFRPNWAGFFFVRRCLIFIGIGVTEQSIGHRLANVFNKLILMAICWMAWLFNQFRSHFVASTDLLRVSLIFYQSINGTSSGVWLLFSFQYADYCRRVLMSWNASSSSTLFLLSNSIVAFVIPMVFLSVRVNEFAFKLSSCYRFQFQNTTKTMTLISDNVVELSFSRKLYENLWLKDE